MPSSLSNKSIYNLREVEESKQALDEVRAARTKRAKRISDLKLRLSEFRAHQEAEQNDAA